MCAIYICHFKNIYKTIKRKVERYQVITNRFSFWHTSGTERYSNLFLYFSLPIYYSSFKHGQFDVLVNLFLFLSLDLLPVTCFIFCILFCNPANSLLDLAPKIFHAIHYPTTAQLQGQRKAPQTTEDWIKYFLQNFSDLAGIWCSTWYLLSSQRTDLQLLLNSIFMEKSDI